MTNSENNDLKEVQREANTYEDEINLMDYFLVLWKRKWFISLASVLPALVIGLAIFMGPRNYKTAYTYDANLNEREYKTLLDRFYCEENLGKIVAGLKEKGLDKYAQKIAESKEIKALRGLVNIEVLPSFFETAYSSAKTSIDTLQKIQQAEGTSLVMTIMGNPQKDMYTISSIMRDDFEKIIPMYSVQEELTNNIEALKTSMAKIEGDRFGLGIELERKKATLEKLKNLKSGDSGNIPSNIILQFNDVNASSAYLPLAHQIQAVDSQIINLEESVKANEERYNYYKSLLAVNERLLDEVKSKIPLYYTIQEFHSFLDSIVKDYKDKELVDYLDAYIKKIENKIASVVPIIKTPKVYPIAKGTVRKSGIVFAISLVISTFAAFLLEGSKEGKNTA